MSDNQGEKLKEYLSTFEVADSNGPRKATFKEISELLGVSRNTLYSYFTSAKLSGKVISNISRTLNVDLKEILASNILNNLKSSDKPKQEVTPIPYEDYMMVEYVDLSASAGPLGGSNVDILPDKKKRLVPKEFDNGNYLVVRVDGDSMVDGSMSSIPDGTEILVKEYILENGDKLPIRGNLFVICSSEGNVFKQIVEHNTEIGYIRCHSYNPNYPDYNIPLNEVHQIFVYKKIVSYRPSIPEIKQL